MTSSRRLKMSRDWGLGIGDRELGVKGSGSTDSMPNRWLSHCLSCVLKLLVRVFSSKTSLNLLKSQLSEMPENSRVSCSQVRDSTVVQSRFTIP